MNTKIALIATFIALSFAAGAYAQTSSGAAGGYGQPTQSTSGSSSTGQQSPKQQIREQHKAAMKKCDGMEGNAKDICKAEADGQKDIAEAQAKVAERDTPRNRLELAEAKAEAQYKISKERCDDQVGDAKKACEQSAKAERDGMLAQAKRESQLQTSGGGASGSASTGQAAAPGAGQPMGQSR